MSLPTARIIETAGAGCQNCPLPVLSAVDTVPAGRRAGDLAACAADPCPAARVGLAERQAGVPGPDVGWPDHPAWAALPLASPTQRAMAAAVALVAWGVLAVAGLLTPSPDGSGTHEQLGLPPCHTKVVLGRPCPSCGMTTAFAFFVRGELGPALKAQVLGAILAAATLLAALGGTVSAATGAHLGLVLDRIFVQRLEWFYVLAVLALGSWGLKAWMGW